MKCYINVRHSTTSLTASVEETSFCFHGFFNTNLYFLNWQYSFPALYIFSLTVLLTFPTPSFLKHVWWERRETLLLNKTLSWNSNCIISCYLSAWNTDASKDHGNFRAGREVKDNAVKPFHFTTNQRLGGLPNVFFWLLAEPGWESMVYIQLRSVFLRTAET